MIYPYSHAAAVQGVEVTSVDSTAVTVSWNVLIVSIDYYTVVYSRIPHTFNLKRQYGEMHAVFNSPATSGVISGLTPGDTYQFQVFATVTVDGRILVGERSTPVNFAS